MKAFNEYKHIQHEGSCRKEHKVIAEKALGRSLKWPEEVHHFDGDKSNNSNSNLVICPNAKYHKLLHARTKALEEFGDVNARPCVCCKQHDMPENMTFISRGKDSYFYHKKCARLNYEANRERILANRRARRATGKRN